MNKPIKYFLVAATISVFTTAAHATELEIFGASGAFPFTIGLHLRELVITNTPDLKLEASTTNRWLGAGITLRGEAGPVGRYSLSTQAALAYSGGVRSKLIARGTFGPIAAELQVAYWTAAPEATNPMVVFDRDSDPVTKVDILIGANLSYRLSRALVLGLNTKFSPEAGSRLAPRIEYREQDASIYGSLLVAWQQINQKTYAGIIGGKYAPEDAPYSLGSELLIGVESHNNQNAIVYGLNFTFDTDLPDDLGSIGTYIAIEPWRFDVYPMRVGVKFATTAGPGQIYTRIGGGTSLTGLFQWGVQFGYVLSIDDLFEKSN